MNTEKPTLILYSSRYGAARQYAEWLAGERDCDLMPAAKVKLTQLRPYQNLIWIGSVYVDKIEGLDSLQRYYRKLTDQRIAVLAVGAAPDERALSLPGDLAELPLYYARGRWDTAALSAKDRLLVNMLKAALTRKPDSAPAWMQELLTQEEPQDFMDRLYLEPLEDFISGRS